MNEYPTVRKRTRARPTAEINLTNLVDVTMVLLIVFILISPMIKEGLEVKLPETTTSTILEQEQSILVVCDKSGKVFVQDKRVTVNQVGEAVKSLKRSRPDAIVLLRADTELAYGTVISVMDAIRSAGITNVGMVTQKADSAAGKSK